MPLKVVYHIAEMGDWKEVIEEQFALLQEVKLNQQVTVTHVGKNQNHIKEVAEKHGVEINIVRSDPNTDHYETFAMLEIDKWCKIDNIVDQILYFHTKGVSWPCPHKTAWRHAMQTQLIYPWKENLKHLSNGYDAVGFGWVRWGQQHFSGNFWMTNPDWIRKLPEYVAYHHSQNMVRFACERWIGAKQWCRAYSLGPTDKNVAALSLKEITSYIKPVIQQEQCNGSNLNGST